MPRLARTVLLTLAFAACGGPTQSAPHDTPPATPSSCDAIVARYRATLATATFACTVDTDCVPYGGVDPDSLCGGAIDAATGNALARIEAERDAAGCPAPGYSCPPIDCSCTAGSCR